jgi:serralysin
MVNIGLVDEEWYLAHYPDVAGAVSAGQFRSGEHHYVAWGIMEGRLPS